MVMSVCEHKGDEFVNLLQALTPRTAEALISLNAGLHCTTTYQQQHRNFFVAKCDSPSGHTEARSRASPKECVSLNSSATTVFMIDRAHSKAVDTKLTSFTNELL